MIVEHSDREIVAWAVRQGVAYYYTDEFGLPPRCLKLQLGHATAYFHSGQLVRLWAHADRKYLDEMFEQLASVFSLCGRSRCLVEYEEADAYWRGRLQEDLS